MNTQALRIGLDIGSTTVKLAVLDKSDGTVYSVYRRHHSHVRKCVAEMLGELVTEFGDEPMSIRITGSAGISVAHKLQITFIQEVIAATRAVETFIPETDVVIELGGEDAKVTFFGGALDQRMNGSCAGGTGSFIDQMAVLLNTDPLGLDDLASRCTTIYPIASRCGVFAKTDVQPLLNEGAAREDIAASIFQAVVNQTIGGLAQGRRIRGNVAYLGGPLFFLPQLRRRFTETLQLKETQVLFPDDGLYYVAVGAALLADTADASPMSGVLAKLEQLERSGGAGDEEVPRLPPLFATDQDLLKFRKRHAAAQVKRRDLAGFTGKCFLGIDAGSTTTKTALVDEDGFLLFSSYGSNGGSPLDSTVETLDNLYKILPPGAILAGTAVTGYGEKLLSAALKADFGEIETVAHYRAAEHFRPGVEFVLDIGGQDMKCLRIRDGAIDEILLNEACSSGCGSFIETFAISLGLSAQEFSLEALKATQAVDLGSRCTVFMNSRVKQAQKEGLTPGDISAGLSYSVIKNALTKVIKIKNSEDFGQGVVVQGGTFHNEAVLRAFELISGREAVRPDICGIMGAFGVALIARDRMAQSKGTTLMGAEELANFSSQVSLKRCELCGNKCRLTLNTFSDGRVFISGNRCERGAGGGEHHDNKLPNLFAYKYKRVFDYKPLAADKSRITVGIPRVLNMYENYPFWFTFLSALGYRVLLSRPSSKKLFDDGLDTIPAESVCYPAKMVHGHIADLMKKKVDIIFYPSVPFEKKEDSAATNHYNCPIVAAYPEVIRTNIDGLDAQVPELLSPFVSMDNPENLQRSLAQVFAGRGFSQQKIFRAFRSAWKEMHAVKDDMRRKGEEVVQHLEDTGNRGIVLCGRPYHVDPEINHGIPEIITGMGLAVLTEDSVAHLGTIERPLRVYDQWVYHSRLYGAAHYTVTNPLLELVQLNSFGCGIDAVTTDQVHEILHNHGELYTLLKIDEGNQLGAARIRLRSLKAVMDERFQGEATTTKPKKSADRVVFTRAMKKRYTIIAPQMSPIHFQFLEPAFQATGYNMVILPAVDDKDIETGLKYVNNDACYPTIITVGQLLQAISSGDFDKDKVAILMTQTGGGCRATNYIAFMRKALSDSGLGHIPVISLNAFGIEKNPGFSLSLSLLDRGIKAILYGDLLMRVLLKVRPYEAVSGSANALYHKWVQRCSSSLSARVHRGFNKNLAGIIRDFDNLPLSNEVKPRVGLVGEILVKFHPTANNQAIDIIEQEGAEAVLPDLFDFFLYSAYDADYRSVFLSRKTFKTVFGEFLVRFLESYRGKMRKLLVASHRFDAPTRIHELAQRTKPVVSLGVKMGEGWFLTGEMIELIESGVENIICMQPFACLPNQITGKGMMKALKSRFPNANIIAIDYDPGASEVNQLNRIKLMLSVAFKKTGELRSKEMDTQIA